MMQIIRFFQKSYKFIKKQGICLKLLDIFQKNGENEGQQTGRGEAIMMNMNSKKTKMIASIIVIVIVVAMLASTLLSAFV